MARQLCADLRNKLVEAHKQRHQHENKIYQSDQIIRRLTKNVETSKVLLSKVHEQCEVWKEQAALSQKNLETLKLRSSEEIEELRKTLNDERQKWKDAESNYELDILRMRDEKASAIREKNVGLCCGVHAWLHPIVHTVLLSVSTRARRWSSQICTTRSRTLTTITSLN